MRHSTAAQKAWSRYVLHGILRFTKQTRSVAQGATAITTLVTDEKYKGESSGWRAFIGTTSTCMYTVHMKHVL